MNSSSLKNKGKKLKEHMINVKIPDECLDPDGGDCEHSRHPVKVIQNPI